LVMAPAPGVGGLWRHEDPCLWTYCPNQGSWLSSSLCTQERAMPRDREELCSQDKPTQPAAEHADVHSAPASNLQASQVAGLEFSSASGGMSSGPANLQASQFEGLADDVSRPESTQQPADS